MWRRLLDVGTQDQVLRDRPTSVPLIALRGLERYGFVRRTVYPEVPAYLEYALTEAGSTLSEPLPALGEWAIAHFGDVSASQEA